MVLLNKSSRQVRKPVGIFVKYSYMCSDHLSDHLLTTYLTTYEKEIFKLQAKILAFFANAKRKNGLTVRFFKIAKSKRNNFSTDRLVNFRNAKSWTPCKHSKVQTNWFGRNYAFKNEYECERMTVLFWEAFLLFLLKPLIRVVKYFLYTHCNNRYSKLLYITFLCLLFFKGKWAFLFSFRILKYKKFTHVLFVFCIY